MIGSDAWLAELKALTARYVEDRVAMGACSSALCTSPAAEGRLHCSTCSSAGKRRSAKLRRERLAEHVCVDCGKQLRPNSYQRCKACRETRSAARRGTRAMYKRLGLCSLCGGDLPDQSTFAQCKPCRDKHSRYEREKRARADAALEESQGN